jgi:hypothetical protein
MQDEETIFHFSFDIVQLSSSIQCQTKKYFDSINRIYQKRFTKSREVALTLFVSFRVGSWIVLLATPGKEFKPGHNPSQTIL